MSWLTWTMVAAGRMAPKNSPWAQADRLPLGDVGDEHAGADDVMKGCTGLLKRGLNGAEGLHGLKVRVARANDASRSGRGRACDECVLADANGAGVADSTASHGPSLERLIRASLMRRA